MVQVAFGGYCFSLMDLSWEGDLEQADYKKQNPNKNMPNKIPISGRIHKVIGYISLVCLTLQFPHQVFM